MMEFVRGVFPTPFNDSLLKTVPVDALFLIDRGGICYSVQSQNMNNVAKAGDRLLINLSDGSPRKVEFSKWNNIPDNAKLLVNGKPSDTRPYGSYYITGKTFKEDTIAPDFATTGVFYMGLRNENGGGTNNNPSGYGDWNTNTYSSQSVFSKQECWIFESDVHSISNGVTADWVWKPGDSGRIEMSANYNFQANVYLGNERLIPTTQSISTKRWVPFTVTESMTPSSKIRFVATRTASGGEDTRVHRVEVNGVGVGTWEPWGPGQGVLEKYFEIK